MTNLSTTTPAMDRATTPTATVTPATPIVRDPGTRLLKKLVASRPALARRDRDAVRA